ncbi:MAG TPA: hypothetical protein VMN36_03865, partial [Verrucomicrobiales bacterium]|nr:hypothetical protein [Verrucomicrobiales bacterium]
ELLFRRSIAQNGFSAAQDWVSSIAGDERNETYKRQAFDRVVRAMVYRDPSLAAHWISQNVGESFAAGDAVAMVAERMSETSPSSALKWMESLAGLPGSAAASGYRAALTALTAQNPDAAGAWLSKNADLPAYDELAARFAQAIAGLDPQSAVAWAQTVGNGAGRDEAIAAVARRHLQEGGEYAEADLLEAGVPQATIDAAGLDRLVEKRLASITLIDRSVSYAYAEEFIGKVQDGADAASVELELVLPADPHQLGGPSMPSGHLAVSPQMQCVDCHRR